MADSIIIRANANQEYRLLVSVNGYQVEAILDTGFTHPHCLIGLGLDEINFRAILPRLARRQPVSFHVPTQVEAIPVDSGVAEVSIVGLDNSQVTTRVVNTVNENLLAVCYFHRLVDFEVLWDIRGQ